MMKFRYIPILTLGVCSALKAQEAGTKEGASVEKEAGAAAGEKSVSLAQQVQQIVNTANDEHKAFMKKVRAEKDRSKAMELYLNEQPSKKPHIDKIMGFAEKDPSQKGLATGLSWVFLNSTGEIKKKALDLMLKHHMDSPAMGNVVMRMARSMQPDLDVIGSVIKESKNEKVRQNATYALATAYNRFPGKKEDSLALYEKLVEWPGIEKSNPKLHTHVKGLVFAAKSLAIGKVAPDIVGTDQDDKEFRLSDYRGKVVLVDFWGIW